jgi:hypothetical protein
VTRIFGVVQKASILGNSSGSARTLGGPSYEGLVPMPVGLRLTLF